jgi:hypothetical protein
VSCAQHAGTFETRNSAGGVRIGVRADGGLEPRNWNATIDDQDGLTAADVIDERAEPVLCLGDRRDEYQARIAMFD